nr:MAG TPA: putative ATP-binding protein [Caudoviricetes sp.]
MTYNPIDSIIKAQTRTNHITKPKTGGQKP